MTNSCNAIIPILLSGTVRGTGAYFQQAASMAKATTSPGARF